MIIHQFLAFEVSTKMIQHQIVFSGTDQNIVIFGKAVVACAGNFNKYTAGYGDGDRASPEGRWGTGKNL